MREAAARPGQGLTTMFGLLAALRRRLPALSRRRFTLLVLGLGFLASRTVALGALEAGAQFPAHPVVAWGEGADDLHQGPPPSAFFEAASRWDGLFYVSIARFGYPAAREEPVFHAAFFPLYPLLLRAVDVVVHDTFLAALLLSNLCAVGGALAALRLGSLFHQGRNAGLATALVFLCSPAAHFLTLPYTEALFVLLAGWSLVFAFEGKPVPAALLGAFATATRSAGVVVVAVLAAGALLQLRERRFARAALWAACAAVSTSGLLAYMAFCAQQYGDALYFSHVMHNWGRALGVLSPLRAVFAFNVDPDYYLMLVLALLGGAQVLRQRRALPAVATWTLIGLPLTTGLLKGFIRYQLTNLPLWAAAGAWLRRRGVLGSALGVSLLWMAYEAFRFGQGYANH